MSVFVSFFILITLQACGSSNSQSNNDSSFQSSSSAEPLIYANPETFSINEDSSLKANLHILLLNNSYLYFRNQDGSVVSEQRSTQGAIVRINDDYKLFEYIPKEDFNGDDEFYYYVSQVIRNGAVFSSEQKIKVSIHVNPIVDQFKIKFDSHIYYAAGNIVEIEALYNPDDRMVFLPDASTTILFDGTLLAHTSTDQSVKFQLPNIQRAGTHQLIFGQTVNGQLVEVKTQIHVNLIKDGVVYYLGNDVSPGQNIIIVFDANETEVRKEAWKNINLASLLTNPVVSTYESYWNLALVTENSPILLTNNLGGVLDQSLREYAAKFSANYNIVVLASINVPGGAAGGGVVNVRIDRSDEVLTHELGHAHAKLCDEYVNINLPTLQEGACANTSHFSTYDLMPWKHWIVDALLIPGVDIRADPKGVGIFDGLFYLDTHRPLYSSVMRDAVTSLGPINTESWALATYERMGILASANSPVLEDALRSISLMRDWNKKITQVDWYINDILQSQWSNQSQIQIDESTVPGASYSISATLTDLTENIRNPNAYGSFNGEANINTTFKKTWGFTKSVVDTKQQKTTGVKKQVVNVNTNQWIRHTLEVENGWHSVHTTQPYIAADALTPVTGYSSLLVDVASITGEVFYTLGVDLTTYDGVSAKTFYDIKHPRIQGAYRLNIYSLPEKKIVQSIDVN